MSHNKPAFIFDVDFNHSLDTLRDELAMLVNVHHTEIHFNCFGPGGGNTQVLIYTDDSLDLAAVEAYAKTGQLAVHEICD